MDKDGLTFANKIALGTLIVTILGIIVAVANPEFREWIGLQSSASVLAEEKDKEIKEIQRKAEEERAARITAEAKQKELERRIPAIAIQGLSIDYNVSENDNKGMRIHIKFTANNLNSVLCRATAYFYYSSGGKLIDSDGLYRTQDGQVCVSTDFTPTYINSLYNDLKLFIPYNQFDLPSGKYNLKAIVHLCKKDGSILASSDYQHITYTKP